MSASVALFFVFAALAVAAALALILLREPIHSALALIVVMVSLAALYLLQGAEFIAAVQVIVYAGAIMVLFVMVIMLLNAGEEERTNRSRMARWVGVPLGCLLTVELAYRVAQATSGRSVPDAAHAIPTRALSTLLFREFVFPFELTSILILIAILGAIVLARKEP
jgi:NADH-quinone oxidoreductase subunit J